MKLILISAFVAGLAYCAAPGVINTEAIRRAVARGFRAALLFQLGALAGDAVWAMIALSGLIVIRPSAELQLFLGGCGAVLLVWMAWGALRDSWREPAPAARLGRSPGDMLLGALLSLANPFAVVFWLGIGGGLLPAGALAQQLPAVAAAVGAFTLATLAWSLALAGIASCGRRLVSGSVFRCLNAGAGICMAALGFGLFWQTVAAM